jgi:DNA-binding transcriptional LysR family regulator
MNLEFYRTFYYVAQYENISKAAESLYITQPAVSRAIKQLEDELGCALFLRTPKGVRLTQEGQILYTYLKQAFNFIETAEKKIDSVRNVQSGEIRVGVSDTLCKHYLVPYLKLFNTLYPGIKVHVTCPNTPGIINLLKSGGIDLGIINMPYKDDKLSFKSILEVQDCFVTGKKLRQLSYQLQPLSEIVKNPMLLLEKNSNSRHYIDEYLLSHSINVTPAFELGNMDLLVHFAKFDFGIACVLRNFVEEDIQKGALYEIKPIERIPPRHVGVAWLKDMPLSAASSKLIDILDYQVTSDI